MGTIHEDSATDQNGNDWDHMKAWRDLLAYPEQMNTATALQIAMDTMLPGVAQRSWTYREIAAARGLLSGIRAQRGVVSADSNFQGYGEDGFEATHQIDIWVFG